MDKQLWMRRVFALAAIGFAVLLVVLPADASGSHRSNRFERWDPETDSPTGQNVAEDCNQAGGTDLETWSQATANIRLKERSGRTKMTFVLRNARPDTLFTVWLRLSGEDSQGNPFGGNPLTGLPVTPLIASRNLPNQLTATPPHMGSDELSNGFRSDKDGNGRLTLSVDFPITSGAYPFQRFPDFDEHNDDVALTNDANAARLGGQPASIKPVAIPDGSQAPRRS